MLHAFAAVFVNVFRAFAELEYDTKKKGRERSSGAVFGALFFGIVCLFVHFMPKSGVKNAKPETCAPIGVNIRIRVKICVNRLLFPKMEIK